ncbi:MAG: proline--tRNA ligase [Spirochaetales bacterium]|nr:proline--tRNA ligase [Spirochaetales bacterium]
MRYSRLVSKTIRETPKSVRVPSHALLLRGGFIRPLSQGLFSYLPLGTRVVRRLKRLIREEMIGLGGQEVFLPLTNPRQIWIDSGRDAIYGEDMIRFEVRSGKKLVLAPTHEEAMVELVKSVVTSYRELPVFLFQFQTKFRNEERPRGGLIRTKEFVMKDGYSFHRSFTELNNFFPRVFEAYTRIFQACRVPAVPAESSVGMMMGDRSYEFLMPTEHGDDLVIRCAGCGYTANADVAVGDLDSPEEEPGEVGRVETGRAHTMEQLSGELGVPRSRLAKTMVYSHDDELILAVVRGDQEVSSEKLRALIRRTSLQLADRDELQFHGILADYVSPIGLPVDILNLNLSVRVIVDVVVERTPNLTIATNEEGVHLTNVNHGRDFSGEITGDISRVLPGARCHHCGGELVEERVLELGHIFRLGDYYSRRLKLSFADATGRRFHPVMGSYGLGLGRLMAAVAEANHDKRGINWPPALAPYRYFLMAIGRSAKLAKIAEGIHEELGDDVLFDDRRVSISAKFKDADLIGVPYRLILSHRTAERGEVELLARGMRSPRRLPIRGIAATLGDLAEELDGA